jgi:hypothetical protein
MDDLEAARLLHKDELRQRVGGRALVDEITRAVPRDESIAGEAMRRDRVRRALLDSEVNESRGALVFAQLDQRSLARPGNDPRAGPGRADEIGGALAATTPPAPVAERDLAVVADRDHARAARDQGTERGEPALDAPPLGATLGDEPLVRASDVLRRVTSASADRNELALRVDREIGRVAGIRPVSRIRRDALLRETAPGA